MFTKYASALNSKTQYLTYKYFGNIDQTIEVVLQNNWETQIPNSDSPIYPVFVHVQAMYGACVGYLCRYDNYGSGILTRYNGQVFGATLDNGVVRVIEIARPH